MSRSLGRVALLVVALTGCRTGLNYPSPLGPRYAGEAVGASRASTPDARGDIQVVTFNIKFGRRIDRAIELLKSAEQLQRADIVTLQEIDGAGAERIAHALGMSFVYYPNAVHPMTGRDFGNAVLSRWPIVDDRKVVLPHLGRLRRTQRAATVATIVIGGDSLRVYSVHLSTQMEAGPGSRRDQAQALLADAASYQRVIVSGDMNSHGIGAEFQRCGFLWLTQDNPRTHLVFNWDHIFLKGMVWKGSSTGVVDNDFDASDHRPVWATLSVAAPLNTEVSTRQCVTVGG